MNTLFMLTTELEDFPPDVPTVAENQDASVAADSPATTATDAGPDDQPKRKRGKRKVMKKTTQRDAKGYLGICCLM